MAVPAFSLLWPSTPPPTSLWSQISPTAAEDLNLAEIVSAIVGSDGPRVRVQQREQFARQTLSQLCLVPELIASRQEVLEDLLLDPLLQERFAEIVPQLEELSDASALSERYRPSPREALDRIVRRLAELELFVGVVRQLHDALEAASIESSKLQQLREDLRQLVQSETFRALEWELPLLRATFANVRSVTIGINLGPDLAPQSASVLGFGTERVDGPRALLGRLLGDSAAATHGITPLRRVERSPEGWQNDLGRDLTQLLQDVAAPVANALSRFASVSAQGIARLGPELGFLLGGVRLAQRLRNAGLPTCRPVIIDADERHTQLEDAYDPGLALRLLAATEAHPA